MEEYVRSTRRWFDRGNPRDAGEADACQAIAYLKIVQPHRCYPWLGITSWELKETAVVSCRLRRKLWEK